MYLNLDFHDLYALYYKKEPFVEDRFHKENTWHNWFVKYYGDKKVEFAYSILNDMRYRVEILFTIRIYYNIVYNDGTWTFQSPENNSHNIRYKYSGSIVEIKKSDVTSNLRLIFNYITYNGFIVHAMDKNFEIKTC